MLLVASQRLAQHLTQDSRRLQQALRRGARESEQQSLSPSWPNVAVRKRKRGDSAAAQTCGHVLVVDALTEQRRHVKPGVRIVDLQQIMAVTGQAAKQRVPPFQVRAPHASKMPGEVTLL